MARLLGRNARNRIWDGLGDGRSTAEYKQRERAEENREWLEDQEIVVRHKTRTQGKKKRKKDHRHKRIPVEGNNCEWVTEEWPPYKYSKIEKRVYWNCECKSLCTVCGDAPRPGNWRKIGCYHKDLMNATQPEEIGYIYRD